MAGGFVSITRTSEELSIVCPQRQVPAKIRRQEGWRAMKVKGPLDFSLTGILSSLATPLAQEGVSVFAISTYDTDYLLVKEKDLERAIGVLVNRGHRVRRNSSE